LREPRSRSLFGEIVARSDDAVDLAEASLLIACEAYPDLEVPRYLARLEEMAVSLRERLAGAADAPDLISALNRYLFGELGFRGNTENYYDPRNSFLNDVLDRRTGIPITLSALYIEVGRRVGLAVEGVGLPGHFIVKAAGPQGDILVDPFHGGALLSQEDCQRRLDRIYEGRVQMEPSMLAPCGRKPMLARMLRNLKAIYTQLEDHPRALGTLELLLKIQPDSAEDVRDRGLLYAALDCYGLAARDLEAYLGMAPGAPDRVALKATIEQLRHKRARVN
jgi:regulator of sirC expression with transglutaminase-like and TPR domain